METPTTKPNNGVGVAPEPNPTPPAQEEYLLFNVMPQQKNTSPVIEPKVSVAAAPEAADITMPTPSKSFLSRPAIIALVVVLIGVLGYGGFMFYKSKQNTKSVQGSSSTLGSVNHAATPGVTTSAEWQKKYFNSEICANSTVCGDSADPDNDGLTNIDEYKVGTDPNNKDSDGDGLADGDEVHVFSSNPLDAHTAKDPKYTDTDFFKGGYDIQHPDTKFTDQQIVDISAKMQQFSLHEPTVSSLGLAMLVGTYKFTPQATTATTTTTTTQTIAKPLATTTALSIDQSPSAKQDRDAQRSNTIKNIGIALIKYNDDKKSFPTTGDFTEMVNDVKIYNKVATNPVDPINQDQFVYGYNSDGKDFTLTFFSESQNQLIRKHMADAIKDKTADEAAVYDDQRKNDIESIKSALLVYSNKNIAGTQTYVFPAADKYKTALVPDYMSAIPKDPQTNKEYEYKVSDTFDTFTLKAILGNPPSGTTGYMCNQDECKSY